MKKLLGKLVCLLLILSLLPSLFGCGLGLDFDFSALFPKPDAGGTGDSGSSGGGSSDGGSSDGDDSGSEPGEPGSIDISSGTPTEWGGGGYAITTTVKDGQTHAVSSYAEANAIIDRAIMSHVHSLTIDYSAISGYSPTDRNTEIELSNHVSIEKRYYDEKPTTVELVIAYHEDAASEFVEPTEENDHLTVLSGNLFARLASIPEEERRTEDFDAFPINSVEKTLAVYNSEELWWALSRGYRPTFPLENSKAESFYLEAKRILREIVTDSMTDYEKLLSIYEYLVSAVEYDYDSYYGESEAWHGKNACYYLEGVFESGRAVCDGKTKAFVLFASIEGIECVRDFGRKRDTGMGHAWNYVKLDGIWYLVDTTAGDRVYLGDVSEFLGDGAEIIDYKSYLLPVDYHSEEYIYSSTWTSITDGATDADRSGEHLALELHDGEERDFIINKMGELSEICSLAFSAIDGAPFSLIVEYDHFVNVHTVLSTATAGKNYEYAVFAVGSAGNEYIILFKPTPPVTGE